jgi:hypothetical protein
VHGAVRGSQAASDAGLSGVCDRMTVGLGTGPTAIGWSLKCRSRFEGCFACPAGCTTEMHDEPHTNV